MMMIPALTGGVLIGLAAVIMLLFTGKIAGNSGIVSALISFKGREDLWKLYYLLGLIAGAQVYKIFNIKVPLVIDTAYPVLIIAGILVGFGTRLGSGCTSGHGICGIARLSKRSIIATVVFMLTGIITVWMTHHIF